MTTVVITESPATPEPNNEVVLTPPTEEAVEEIVKNSEVIDDRADDLAEVEAEVERIEAWQLNVTETLASLKADQSNLKSSMEQLSASQTQLAEAMAAMLLIQPHTSPEPEDGTREIVPVTDALPGEPLEPALEAEARPEAVAEARAESQRPAGRVWL